MRSRAIAPFSSAATAIGARKLAPISASRSDSNTLQDERRTRPSNGIRHGRRATDAVLFHSGTDSQAPLWHEQALRPVFVAQLLGQSDERGASTPSAPVAYGEHARQGFGPLLIDQRI